MAISFTILPASKAHIQDIQKLAHKIWHEHYPGIITKEQIIYMLSQDYAIETLEADLLSGIHIDQLILDDELRGFAAYGQSDLSGQAKLYKLYLDLVCHGQGLGSAFLQHIEKVCHSRNFHKIVLQVNKQNTKAIRSYKRNGYHIQEETIVNIGKGFVMDDFIMAKNLSQSG